MEKVLRPVEDTNLLGHLEVAVKYYAQIQEEEEEMDLLEMSGEKEAIFHADSWESEALWQFLRVMHEDMKRPLPDLIQLLDYMKKQLEEENMVQIIE